MHHCCKCKHVWSSSGCSTLVNGQLQSVADSYFEHEMHIVQQFFCTMTSRWTKKNYGDKQGVAIPIDGFAKYICVQIVFHKQTVLSLSFLKLIVASTLSVSQIGACFVYVLCKV